MPAYSFLDLPARYLVDNHYGVWAYCKCGHHVHLTPDGAFTKHRDLGLHAIVARMRCIKCGSLGAIESVIVAPTYSNRPPGT